jgi:protein TonB
MKAVVIPLIIFLALAVSARADEKFEPPVPVRTTAPVFPYEMHQEGVSGFVLVNCLVDEQGNVQDMRIEKTSNPQFVAPALDALKKWKFKPAEKDGSRIPTRVSIPIRFTYED